MTSQEKGRALPKFGEWDVNNPASADGFTVIFAKARDEKAKGSAAAGGSDQAVRSRSQSQSAARQDHYSDSPKKTGWLCCF